MLNATVLEGALQAGRNSWSTPGAVLTYAFVIVGLSVSVVFLWGVVHALWKEGKEADGAGINSQALDVSQGASPGWYDEENDGWVLDFSSYVPRFAQVDRMSGHRFERYVGEVLELRGYEVEQKGGVGDFGADMIASREGRRYVVQAKRRAPDSKIGPKVVRATIGAREHFGCSRAMVVTNAQFSRRAKKQAGRACRLVDRTELAEWIKQI